MDQSVIKFRKIFLLFFQETAEMPDTYEKGKFDIAGFAVGIVDEKKILKKEKIKKNNLIIAIPSNGIHSNG